MTHQYADGITKAVENDCGPKGILPWYLMAGLMYYHFDNPILTDGRFDEIAKTLLASWDEWEHNHKHFVTKEELEAGTLLLKLENFPHVTRAAAHSALRSTGRDLTPEQKLRLDKADFTPPLALQDDVNLYAYYQQGGIKKPWSQIMQEKAHAFRERQETKEVSTIVRTRKRPPLALPEPKIIEHEFNPLMVRTRTRVR